MKSFLQFSIGAFLLCTGLSLVIYSVKPAYGEHGSKDHYMNDTGADLRILYVNIDSINLNYIPFVELSEKAGGTLQDKMKTYQEKAIDLETRYAKLQEQVNMGTISTIDAEKEENAINTGLDELKRLETELAYLEQEAMAKNDSISQEILPIIEGRVIA